MGILLNELFLYAELIGISGKNFAYTLKIGGFTSDLIRKFLSLKSPKFCLKIHFKIGDFNIEIF